MKAVLLLCMLICMMLVIHAESLNRVSSRSTQQLLEKLSNYQAKSRSRAVPEEVHDTSEEAQELLNEEDEWLDMNTENLDKLINSNDFDGSEEYIDGDGDDAVDAKEKSEQPCLEDNPCVVMHFD